MKPETGVVEQIAQWLYDETDHEDSSTRYTWPEHPDDTGQREGGFVRIVPSDVQARFRETARRLVARFGPLASSAPGTIAPVRDPADWINALALQIAGRYGFGLYQPEIDAIKEEIAKHSPSPSASEKEKEIVEALEPFAKFAEKAEAFVDARAKDGGSPILSANDFRLSDFRRARAALLKLRGRE